MRRAILSQAIRLLSAFWIAVIWLLALSNPVRAADQPFDVVVTADPTRVMAGEKPIGEIKKGTRLTVSQADGDRYLIDLPKSNPPQQGWIRKSDVKLIPASATSTPRLMVQLGHSNEVSSVAFSPDGKLVLTGSRDHTALLWDAASGKEIRRFEGHSFGVTSVAFSPDGNQVLTGSADKTARLWDAASGKEIRRFEEHSGPVTSVAFSPDGKQLLTGSGESENVRGGNADNTARLWDGASGQEIRRFDVHSAKLLSVEFSPNGKQVLTGSDDDTARLWDVASGKEIRHFKGHSGGVNSVAFSPDGKQVLTGSRDATARLWNAATGKEIRRFAGRPDGPLFWANSVAFSPDGNQVLTGSQDDTARLWNAASGKEIRQFKGQGAPITSVVFSPGGNQILTGSFDRSALWDAASGKETRQFDGLLHRVATVRFSPDGKQVLAGSYRTVRLWDAASGNEIRQFKGHSDWITSVVFSPDGKQVLTGSMDNTARLWDAASGKEIRQFEGNPAYVNSVAFSPDGKQVLTGSDCKLVLTTRSDGSLDSAARSDDNRERDATARLWDAASGKQIGHFDERSDGIFARITSVAFSPDGNQVLTGSADKTARLWDTASGKEIRRFVGHSAIVTSVSFSPDGKQVLTGSDDDSARLWDAATGKEIRRFAGHSSAVVAVAFSPDGKRVLTGSWDCTSRIWDAATGKELCTLVSFNNGDWAVVDSEGRFDAANGGEVQGLHWVVGNEPIELVQLKERYYDPGLLAKKLGFNKDPLRKVEAFDNPKLFPEVKLTPPAPGETKLDIRLTNRGGGIGRVVVKINGKELTRDARGDTPNPHAATLSIPLDLANDPRLVPGKENEIEVQAFNADGYLSSRGIEMPFVDPREKVVAEKPDVWALVVGVSHFQGGKIDLHYASKDADDFATGLQIAATRLFGADKVHLTKLTSPPPEDPKQPNAAHRPTHENLLAALVALQDPKRVKANDILIVYLAGHGVTRGGSDDSFCYLTCDAQSANLSDPEVRKEWTISDQELTEWISKSPAQHQVMILDTCHSGKVVEDLTKPRDVSSSQERALERLKDNTGLHILAGCAADSGSYEASRYGQGVLTYSLLLGMRGGALKEDQFVDVGTLFNFAVDRVPTLAGDIGGIQRPVIASPKGSSFEIGQVTAEDRSHIPLQPVRPMVLRTIFHDEDELDPLNLSEQMDELFRTVAARGNNPPLTFVDARKLPGAYRVAGRYRISAGKVTVTVRLAPAEEKGVTFEVSGETAKLAELAAKIAEEIQKRLPAPTIAP